MERRVKGQSMLPYIRTLDKCITQDINFEEIRRGDIVVYHFRKSDILAVHRVLKVNSLERTVLVKGDNIPLRLAENIPFKDIIEKVIAIENNRGIVELDNIASKINSRRIAFLSRYDLTPYLIKKRFLDPILLSLTRNHLFVSVRKNLYRDISYVLTREKSKCKILASVNKDISARGELSPAADNALSLRAYIRYRDRNEYFALKFIEKVISIAEIEYGPGYNIYINDPILKELVKKTDTVLRGDKVYFVD